MMEDPKLRAMEVGVKVYSLKTKETILSYQEDKILKPASNLKLITTLAALKYLGSEYRFKTKVYSDGPIENDILKGNLYVKGFGDPLLVSEQLWYLTNDLRRVGFRQVQGHLILDESFFDAIREVPHNLGKGERAYDAPLGALSINFNTTAIYVSPGVAVGTPAKVTVDPDNTYIKLINRSKTVSEHAKKTLEVIRLSGKDHDVILVKGQIPLATPEKRYYRNITHPLYYAAAMVRRFFQERGMTIQGKDKFERVPKGAQEILVYESRPLRILVSDLNKISNNFIAEQILKTLGAELKGEPGTTDKGLSVLKEFLMGLGIHNGYQMVNGSGLSLENRMSAAQLVEVLKYGFYDFKLFPEYVSSMGIVGVDGTVEGRLKNTPVQGEVRVKTGSLTGVSALSGYLVTKQDEILVFSFLMNDAHNRQDRMQDLQDKLLLLLSDVENGS